MRTLFYMLLAAGAFLAACRHRSSDGSKFEMRLVVDQPSTNSENLPFTNRFPAASASIQEVLPVAKAAFIDRTGVASAKVETYPGNTNFYVEITFTAEGRRRLAEATRENIGRHIAIVVDGAVISAPKIEAEISDGRALIAATFSKVQARVLADQINDAAEK